jgi:ribosomal protein S27E
MDAQMLDGNAAAGMLQDVFAAEPTTMIGTCASCGTTDALGAAHAYHGAGMVLRCRVCDTVLMKIVRGEGRLWIGLPGVSMLEIPVAG